MNQAQAYMKPFVLEQRIIEVAEFILPAVKMPIITPEPVKLSIPDMRSRLFSPNQT